MDQTLSLIDFDADNCDALIASLLISAIYLGAPVVLLVTRRSYSGSINWTYAPAATSDSQAFPNNRFLADLLKAAPYAIQSLHPQPNLLCTRHRGCYPSGRVALQIEYCFSKDKSGPSKEEIVLSWRRSRAA